MHIELGRHIPLVNALKQTFSESQIISTTHSYIISRSFGEGDGIYDLRLINANKIVKNEPWRLKIFDEIKDCMSKIGSITSLPDDYKSDRLECGKMLQEWLMSSENDREQTIESIEKFFTETSVEYIRNSMV